ncbi:MAG TPA: hypothetical protein VFX06_05735 [Stellaceae bacterium]|nr:hypothetical protein [Stellaceae bacterium]
MQIFDVRVEPLGAAGPDARAIVIAQDEGQAVALMRNDGRFSGYRLPPAEMVRCSASRADVRRALGDTATHEIGVYAFAVLGEPGASPATPPAALGC